MGTKSPYRRGSLKEQATKKLSGRQCTFMVQTKHGSARRQCKNNTGKNYFFCDTHFHEVDDTDLESINL